jgi:sodium/potassium-transporting ATPase subunit alpha
MAPAISFAYENPELDIMERQPRNAKRDNLTNKKLFALSYTQIGVLEAAGGLFTYLLIMNDYGIRPTQIWYLALIEAPMVNSWDVYNQT